MGFINKMRTDYESIFDTLIDYLNENIAIINRDMEKEEKALKKSWALTQAAGVKLTNALDRNQIPDYSIFAEFSALRRKWG